MTVANSIQSQLDEAEHVIRAQSARIAELEVEVERLRSEASAHDVLRSIYLDEAQPSGTRLKAAGLALNVEKPRLTPVPPPLDLAAEEIEPLAVVVERQRKRADAMQGRNIKVMPSGQVLLLDERNGSDD